MTGLILVCADLSYHHQYGFQDPATTFFEMLIDFHHDMMFLLILVFLFVFYLLMATIYYFNDKSSSRPPVNLRYNTKIETIWTVVPALLLGWILMPAFSLIYAMDGPAGLPSIGFKAVGNQWYWNYQLAHGRGSYCKNYAFDSTMVSEQDAVRSLGKQPRLLAVDNPLVLPVGLLIRIGVTANDVIHSWAVPSFGIKLDGCPGRLNVATFLVKRKGIFYGQCSEICGTNHGFMPIEVRVVSLLKFLS